MSALGQKQTCAMHQPMSALPPIATAKADMPQTLMSALHPKADMCGANRHVCFGPKADIQLAMRTPISVARRIRPWGYGLNKKCVPGHSRYMRGVNNGDRAVNY